MSISGWEESDSDNQYMVKFGKLYYTPWLTQPFSSKFLDETAKLKKVTNLSFRHIERKKYDILKGQVTRFSTTFLVTVSVYSLGPQIYCLSRHRVSVVVDYSYADSVSLTKRTREFRHFAGEYLWENETIVRETVVAFSEVAQVGYLEKIGVENCMALSL